jgi:hypothetical protein
MLMLVIWKRDRILADFRRSLHQPSK